jgi:hypothetical protein
MVLLSQESMAVDDSEEKPGKDPVLRGDATCTACHDEDSDSPVLSIGKTRHGTAADARTPTCASCHGGGNGHRNNPQKVFSPPRTIGKSSTNSIEDRNGVCLACHEGGQRMHWPVVPIRIGMLPAPPAIKYILSKIRYEIDSPRQKYVSPATRSSAHK